jgi:SAM-dependent methyltransferase
MSDIHSEKPEAPCEDIRALYSDLARNPDKEFGWGKGKENARALGYEARWLECLPERIWESAAAVGNPFSLGPIRPGEVVVDLGCGAGADLCIAALLVGTAGRAMGIDLTPAMVQKAQENAALAGLGNVEAYIGDVEATSLADACADVVISNGAINLSAHKPCVFQEAFRILKPGGRLQFADMVRAGVSNAASSDSWAGCVAGTVEPERYLEMLRAAGFTDAELVGFTGYKTAAVTIGATFKARRP